MAVNWKGILSTVAPTLATALGSPIAGAAVAAIARALNSEPTDQAISAAIQSGKPEILEALRRADQEFAVQMRKLDLDFAKLVSDENKGQQELTKLETASDSLLKSGWRPSLGWTCVAGFAYQFLGRPLIEWVSVGFLAVAAPPSLDTGTLVTMLGTLLGVGGLRTLEKLQGKN